MNEFDEKVLRASLVVMKKQFELHKNWNWCNLFATGIQAVLFPEIKRASSVKLGISATIQRLKRQGLIKNYHDNLGQYVITEKGFSSIGETSPGGEVNE